MKSTPQPQAVRRGFTLMELLCGIVIIIILASLMVPAYQQYLGRADRGNCQSNLRNLYAAMNLYLGDNQTWPQIRTGTNTRSPEYALAWHAALKPYSIAPKNWICPAVQRALKAPDITKQENVRIDYFAMPFDSRTGTPHKWPMQPWFMERANVHGDGQLMILTNGDVKSLMEIRKSKGKIYQD